MSEAKHTPGPWWVEVDIVPEAGLERKWPTIHSEKYEVVGCEGLYGDYETYMANARLIAAAPDLLEALHLVRDYIATMKGSGHEYSMSIDAAIAKATKVQNSCKQGKNHERI